MYMDILEQEVEALSAEVTRLRLMVHRVTQVMEAPIPGHHHHRHVDPLHVAQPPTATNSGNLADLQVTVDSYKQLLPLIQLLLAQQQQQQRSGAKDTISEQRRKTSRHSHHKRRNRRPDSSCRTESCSSPSGSGATSPRSRPQGSAAPSFTLASSHHHHDKPTSPVSHLKTGPARSSSSSSPQKPTIVKEDDQRVRLEPAVAQGSGQTPFADQRRTSAVSIHETSTQEEPPAANEQERTLDSSAAMPMAELRSCSGATSLSESTRRRMYVMNASTVAKTQKKSAPATMPTAAASPHRQSATDTSRKLQRPPSEQETESRTALSLAEGVGYQSLSALLHGNGMLHTFSESPLSSKRGSLHSSAWPHGSVANSIVHSEQGMYNYSALPSLYNSPALSHVLEDTLAGTKAAPVTWTPSWAPPQQETSSQERHKQPRLQMSARSYAPENASSSSDTSEESTGEDAAERQNTLQTIISNPYRGGVILGVRQPIRVQSLNNPPASVSTSVNVRGAGGKLTAAQAPSPGGCANTVARTNPSPGLRPVSSESGGTTSSSSDDATLRHPRLHNPTEAHHRDSSFHNYSDAASSQDTGTRSSQRTPPDPAASQSHDPYDFASYALQHSVPQSLRQKGIDASPSSSQELLHSISPYQLAQSISLSASSMSRQGSIAAGGYYYGYNLAIGIPSQSSMASSPLADA
ncbi:hypothetical protein Q4I28_008392 [Leishmania naiffi]|uniref:Uncharacterized protein n=1 Tax=Leishmania naiffi TaxID=5678 RepID=A0AAW3B5M0_9TRYP